MYIYPVDENPSKIDVFLKAHSEFANVKYAIYPGAEDEIIVKMAIEEGPVTLLPKI